MSQIRPVFYVSDGTGITAETIGHSLLTQINYFSAELDGSGNVIDDHHWPAAQLVAFAHDRGVKVKLSATLFGGANLTTLLGSSTNRLRAISQLLARVRDAGADGVDIDFEGLPAAQRENMVIPVLLMALVELWHTLGFPLQIPHLRPLLAICILMMTNFLKLGRVSIYFRYRFMKPGTLSGLITRRIQPPLCINTFK